MFKGDGKKLVWENRSLIWSYIKPYIGLQLETFICMFISALLNLPGPFFIQMLVDNVLIGGNFQYIGMVICGLVGINISKVIFGLLENYIFTYFSGRILADIRTDLLDKVLSLKIEFFNENKLGSIMARLTQDITVISEVMTTTVLRFVIDLLTVVFVLIILIVLNWQLTILSLLIVPIFAIIFTIFNRYVKKVARELRERYAELNGFLQEVLNNILLVKVFNLTKYMSRKYFGQNSNLIRSSIKNSIVKAIAQNVNELTLAVGPILILIFGARQIIEGTLSIGTLTLFYIMIGRLYSPLRRLINMNIKLQTALASFERILEYLKMEPEESDGETKISNGVLSGEIEFKNVTFSYKGSDSTVLKDMSFKINAGEKIGIVGESGGGKTTILNLLLGFYEVTSGQILIDGIPIERYSKSFLRRQIGLVSQDTFLLNMSIQENLKIANRSCEKEEIWEVAKKANIHEFIDSLPNKYQQLVGEKGMNLSGGQKQRLSIARMLLKRSPIAILDEATSALDFKSENYISRELLLELREHTVLVVGHRFSMINHLDRVIVIKDGQIVEEGNPKKLLSKGGYYAFMYNEQYNNIHLEVR